MKKLNLPTTLNCLKPNQKWNAKSLIRNMQSDKKRVDKNIKVNIKSLEGKILEKSLRNLIK